MPAGDTTVLYYLHTDYLGSTKLVTDQDGNAVQAPTQYDPQLGQFMGQKRGLTEKHGYLSTLQRSAFFC